MHKRFSLKNAEVFQFYRNYGRKMKLIFPGLFIFLSIAQIKSQVPISRLPDNAIPITYNRAIYIKAKVDGVQGNFVFDTGADNFYFDTTFYSRNNFNYDNLTTAKLPGAGKIPQRVPVILDTVTIVFGNQTYKTSQVPVLQLKPITGDYADGIVGLMCCINSVLEINYQKQFMRIRSTIDSININEFYKIGFTFKNDRITIPLSVIINDTVIINGDFMVDMGMGGALVLSGTVSNKYNLENIIPDKTFSYSMQGGVGGETREYLFLAKSCSLGKFIFNNVLTGLGIDSTGNIETKKYTGMIGNGLLERFDVIIDFTTKNLYLKPNSDFSKPFRLNPLGFTYSDRTQTKGGWIVNGFDKNSNAEKSGLLINDKIISVNKIPVGEIPIENQKHFFNEIKNVILQVERENKILVINFHI